MHHFQTAVFHPGYVLMPEALMNHAVKGFLALGMITAMLKDFERFRCLDQSLLVVRALSLVTTELHGLLDDKQGFPATEHMRIG